MSSRPTTSVGRAPVRVTNCDATVEETMIITASGRNAKPVSSAL